MTDEVVSVKKMDEIWSDFHTQLQGGIENLSQLHKAYGLLTKFMSLAMWRRSEVKSALDLIGEDGDAYQKQTRSMILEGTHYNERRLIRHLKLPKAQKDLVIELERMNDLLEDSQKIQRLLKDRFDLFRLEYLLSGGSYEV